MRHSFVTVTRDIAQGMEAQRKDVPETIREFGAMVQAAMKEGAIDALSKEPMETLAIGARMGGVPIRRSAAKAVRADEACCARTSGQPVA